MIIGEIRRHLRDNTAIRVSRSMRDIAYKALQARDALIAKHGREPKIEEIAQAVELPEADVIMALDAIQAPVSLFEPMYHDDGDPVYVMDQVCDENELDNKWLEQINIEEGMSHLTDREQRIINMRFFSGKTQMEVADEIGISQAQVSRLEKGALLQLRKYM